MILQVRPSRQTHKECKGCKGAKVQIILITIFHPEITTTEKTHRNTRTTKNRGHTVKERFEPETSTPPRPSHSRRNRSSANDHPSRMFTSSSSVGMRHRPLPGLVIAQPCAFWAYGGLHRMRVRVSVCVCVLSAVRVRVLLLLLRHY